MLMKGLLLCAFLCFVGLVNSFPGKYEKSNKPMGPNEVNLHKISKRAIPTSTAKKWMIYNEDGNWIIPYVIRQDQPTVNPVTNMFNGTDIMLRAITDYNDNSCIRFRPRTTEEKYLTIRFRATESSSCGKASPGEDPHHSHITINFYPTCEPIHSIRHELYHKLLYLHEQYRPDRDDYVMSDSRNRASTRNKYQDMTLISGYDIFSVMHYDTFILKYKNIRGWKETAQMSYHDIEALNFHYQCPRSNVQKRSCDVVPTIVGVGELYPLQEIYKHKQGVRLICGNGNTPTDHQYSYCEDGEFVPSILKCEKATTCNDKLPSRLCRMMIENDENFCEDIIIDKKGKPKFEDWWPCRKTCGRCNNDVCTKLPTLYGSGFVGSRFDQIYLSEIYGEGDEIHVYCSDEYYAIGPTSSTCINGQFNVTQFQCVPLKVPIMNEVCSYKKFEGIEGGIKTCQSFFPQTCKSLPDVNIKHGKFYHEHTIREVSYPIFYANDYAILQCDRGYQPISSPVAQCRFNKVANRPHWSHTKLECIPIPPNQNGCAAPPVFNRKRSSLSPLKYRYNYGEEVTLTCFPGHYYATTRTATCMQNGQFDKNFFYACAEGHDWTIDNGYCNNWYLDKSYGGGQHIRYPIMDYYPKGFAVKFHCHTTGNYDRLNGSNHDVLECNSAKWNNWNLNGNQDRCQGMPYCTGDQLYWDTQQMNVRLQPWNSTWNFTTLYEDGVARGESIQIDCGFGFETMIATCSRFDFRYQNVCNFTRNVEISTTERSCRREDLPQVYGEEGRFHPDKSQYQHLEAIYMDCADGSTTVTPSQFWCINGKFSVDRLICRSDECIDEETCTTESCNDEERRERCRLTCGLCEGDGCFVDSFELESGIGSLIPRRSIYRHGENVTAHCSPEYDFMVKPYNVTSTCWNGYFNNPMPWCLNENQDVFKLFVEGNINGDSCEKIREDIVEDCLNDRHVRYLCSKTCRDLISDRDPSLLVLFH